MSLERRQLGYVTSHLLIQAVRKDHKENPCPCDMADRDVEAKLPDALGHLPKPDHQWLAKRHTSP